MFHPTRRGATQRKKQTEQPGRPAPESAAHVAQPMWGATPALNLAPMERTLGADLSDVRIHPSSSKASEVGALAYTQGSEVHFAPGQFNPESRSGRQLLGHELAHVVQQREGRVQPSTQLKGLPLNDDPQLEKEADALGTKAAQAALDPEAAEVEDEEKLV
ncbi:MAG TPA: DUF4157 domain-containing protein [Symbiobacteriaceae bacterium]|nr:DUF4157 domain-containing protein [Symbiobacteriaceae bacterium]